MKGILYIMSRRFQCENDKYPFRGSIPRVYRKAQAAVAKQPFSPRFQWPTKSKDWMVRNSHKRCRQQDNSRKSQVLNVSMWVGKGCVFFVNRAHRAMKMMSKTCIQLYTAKFLSSTIVVWHFCRRIQLCKHESLQQPQRVKYLEGDSMVWHIHSLCPKYACNV